ncbi:DUF6270 domain-containing protein [Arthrobacter rhizosphaerae]|uniref:DUF6270 domain-containing protein n=1 Tax=Arthrobacter rhizosphaerae TaxID=2855490 RepID=UPI001FF494C4|nr:DUF6270 domain-containing protein [Arthrobacter rhizosphaerae]
MARIYIYGSCVSRDAFDFLDKSENELLGYTARQSLISATNKPYLADASKGALSSRFQIKNLQGDFDGNAIQKLSEIAESADYIFWDLTDERLGVIELDEDIFITRSTELVQSELLGDQTKQKWIKFGTDEHLELWTQAVARFSDFVRSKNLETKIVLFNLSWSMYDDGEAVLGRYFSMLPDEANNTFARYVAVIRECLDVFSLEVPWETAIANRDHKWTLAPYHYVDDVYTEVVHQLAAHGTRRKTPRTEGLVRELKSPEKSSEADAWRDAVGTPLRLELPPDTSSFGIEFEAQTHLPHGRHLLISLDLRGATDSDLAKNRIAKSGHEDIGFFRYVDVDRGRRSYFSSFELSAGVTCASISVRGWQIESDSVSVRQIRTCNAQASRRRESSESNRGLTS